MEKPSRPGIPGRLTATRRRFLQAGAATGAALLTGPTLLGRPARAAAGGSLRIGIGDCAPSDTLDLSKVNGTAMTVQAQRLLRTGLVQLDTKSNPQPSIAESWEPSPDAKIWRFKLRNGVQFHNGKAITPEDVIFSINLHRGENTKSAAKPLMSQIAEMKKDGADGVVFTLVGGNADFPVYMTDYHVGIVPENADNSMSDISSGPYALEHFEPGVNLQAKKFANYWDPKAAKFDEVELVGINDVGARTDALISGRVDAINRVDTRTAAKLNSTKGFKVARAASGHHITFPMDTTVAPFSNNDLRLALKYAVDREQMLKTVLQGYGSLGNDQPISAVYRFFAADIPQRAYDPDKAKFHLKKAGMAGQKIPFSISEAEESGIDYGTLYQQQAAKAGIDIELVREPVDGYWDNVWLKKPFVQSSWYGRATADAIMTLAYSAGAPWNESHWDNAKFNQILKEARAELDQPKRAALYREAQLLIRDDGGAIVPVFADYLVAMKDTLKNDGHMSGSEDLDGWRFAERWWFA